LLVSLSVLCRSASLTETSSSSASRSIQRDWISSASVCCEICSCRVLHCDLSARSDGLVLDLVLALACCSLSVATHLVKSGGSGMTGSPPLNELVWRALISNQWS